MYKYISESKTLLIYSKNDLQEYINSIPLHVETIVIQSFNIDDEIADLIIESGILSQSGISSVIILSNPFNVDAKEKVVGYANSVGIQQVCFQRYSNVKGAVKILADMPDELQWDTLASGVFSFDEVVNLYVHSSLKLSDLKVEKQRLEIAGETDDDRNLILKNQVSMLKKNCKEIMLRSEVKTFSVGYDYSMIVSPNGVYAYGSNRGGQLSLGHNSSVDVWDRVILPEDVRCQDIIDIHTSDTFSVLHSSKGIYLSGIIINIQLTLDGDIFNSTFTKIKLPDDLNVEDIIEVSVAIDHIILHSRNGLYAFGRTSFHQLGLHDANEILKIELPEDIEPNMIVKVFCSGYSTVIHTTKGLLGLGQGLDIGNTELLGDGYTGVFKYLSIPFKIEELKSLSLGMDHIIAHTNDRIYTQGNNINGQLGIGVDSWSAESFVRVNLPLGLKIDDIVGIAAGRDTSFIYTKNRIYSAGNNSRGQLGIRDINWTNVFTEIDFNFKDIVSVKSCNEQTIIKDIDGSLYGFGDNYKGTLGVGFKGSISNPTKLNFTSFSFLIDSKVSEVIGVPRNMQSPIPEHNVAGGFLPLHGLGTPQGHLDIDNEFPEDISVLEEDIGLEELSDSEFEEFSESWLLEYNLDCGESFVLPSTNSTDNGEPRKKKPRYT